MPYTPINDYSANLGSTHGLHLDQEFAAVAADLRSLRNRLAAIQRADGRLSNLTVTFDALAADVRALMQLAPDRYRGNWQSGGLYRAGETASHGNSLWLSTETHYGGATFDGDRDSGLWVEMGASGAGVGVPNVVELPTDPSAVGGARIITFDGSAYVWNDIEWVEISGGIGGGGATIPTFPELPLTLEEAGGARVILLTSNNKLYRWTGEFYTAEVDGADVAEGTLSVSSLYGQVLRALSASTGELETGTLVIDDDGYIRGGQTDYNVGDGFWLGKKDGTYRLSLANPNQDRLTFGPDGATIRGALNVVAGAASEQVSNGVFNDFTGWYRYDGVAPLGAVSLAGWSIAVVDGQNRATYDPATVACPIASEKFRVEPNDRLRVRLLGRGVSPTEPVAYYSILAFSFDPLLPSPAVHQAVQDDSILVDARVAQDAYWEAVDVDVLVPPGAYWCSLVIGPAA